MGELEYSPLSKLCDPERGITYGIVKVGDFVSGGVRVIRGGDIRNGRIVFDAEKKVSEEISRQFQRTILRGGEIVINLIAEPGHTAIVPTEFAGANVSRDVGVIPLNNTVDHRYVDYYLKSPMAIQWLTARLQGSVTQKINLGTLNEMPVPVPPLEEQSAISHILGTLDDKIELNRRMNETLEAIARTLFKSWFVDFDPVRAKMERRDPGLPRPIADLFPDSFEDSELGEIPKGWCTSSVYDLATYINGAAYRAFEPNEERRGLPIIKIAELKAGVTAQTRFSAVDMLNKYRIDTGDILFSWSGNPDTSIDIFVWTHGPAWLNQHIFRIVPTSEHERAFVLMTLRSLRPVFAEVARNKQTTGLGHVTVEDLKRLLTVRPPETVLLGWNSLVESMLDRSFGLEEESNTLAALRDTLLPKLISGELRVPHLTCIAGSHKP